MAVPVSGGSFLGWPIETIQDNGYRWENEAWRGTTRLDYGITEYPQGSAPVARWEARAFAAGMAAWEQVADIDFRPARSADRVDLVIGVMDTRDLPNPPPPELLAFQEGPYQASLKDDGEPAVGGYFRDRPSWTAAGTEPAGRGFLTILHELGHFLGLAHPFDEGPSGWSSVEGDVEDISTLSTVMAYAGWKNDPGTGYADLDHLQVQPLDARPTLTYGHFPTPTARDIAAVQILYGANLDRDDGDGDGSANDVYRLPGSNSAGTGWTTIWDTGGIDWIQHSGAREAHISLEPMQSETFSQGGLSQVREVRGGLMIADDITWALGPAQDGFRGVLIENAAGGSGVDRIEGNSVANALVGRAGGDRITGFGGADRISGGPGDDVLSGGSGGDMLRGGTQNDVLWGGKGHDILHGDGGDDLLVGSAGADRFVFLAGGGVDMIRDFSGSDVIDLRPFDLSFGEIIADSRNPSVGVRLYLGDTEIRLVGVDRAELTREDFLL